MIRSNRVLQILIVREAEEYVDDFSDNDGYSDQSRELGNETEYFKDFECFIDENYSKAFSYYSQLKSKLDRYKGTKEEFYKEYPEFLPLVSRLQNGEEVDTKEFNHFVEDPFQYQIVKDSELVKIEPESELRDKIRGKFGISVNYVRIIRQDYERYST